MVHYSQVTFATSKSTIETLEKDVNIFNVNNKNVNDVILCFNC